MTVYFDIDGVLNDTPARGNRGFFVDPEKVEILQRATEGFPLVCISWWRCRHDLVVSQQILLDPLIFTWWPANLEKSKVPLETPHLIIDDQPTLYLPAHHVYPVEGSIGLTEADVVPIHYRLHKGFR